MIKDHLGDCFGAVNSIAKFTIGGLKGFMADSGKNNIGFKRNNLSDVQPSEQLFMIKTDAIDFKLNRRKKMPRVLPEVTQVGTSEIAWRGASKMRFMTSQTLHYADQCLKERIKTFQTLFLII